MSIPGFGDAVTLFDTSMRIISFINDLRHAQDDLLGLHSEANTLRISINAVTSDACAVALYRYISIDQGRDLRTIVDILQQNLEDLNRFIASCAALVEKRGVRDGKLPQTQKTGQLWAKRKSWTGSVRRAFAKCWAAYKFVMSDKQAYRDKLILPTQSVNVFLTSMTHVGLANVGMLAMAGGGLPLPVGPLASNVPVFAGNRGQINGLPTGADSWDVVGTRIALKNVPFITERHLPREIEEEVLLYLKHLLKSGDKFSTTFRKGRERFQVTKMPISRIRSRSLLLRGRQSTSERRPSSSRTRIERRSDSKGVSPGRRLLGPAPLEYVEVREPDFSDEDDNIGGRRGKEAGLGRDSDNSDSDETDLFAPPSPTPRIHGSHSRRQNRAAREPENSNSRYRRTGYGSRNTFHSTLNVDLDQRTSQIEAQIEREQRDAIAMIERAEEPRKTERRTRMREDTIHSEKQKQEIAQDDELADTELYLFETYGLMVSDAAGRPEVDNGEVDAVTDEVKYDKEYVKADKLKAETARPDFTQSMHGRRDTSGHFRPMSERMRFETTSRPRYDTTYSTPSMYMYRRRPEHEDSKKDERPRGVNEIIIDDYDGAGYPERNSGDYALYRRRSKGAEGPGIVSFEKDKNKHAGGTEEDKGKTPDREPPNVDLFLRPTGEPSTRVRRSHSTGEVDSVNRSRSTEPGGSGRRVSEGRRDGNRVYYTSSPRRDDSDDDGAAKIIFTR